LGFPPPGVKRPSSATEGMSGALSPLLHAFISWYRSVGASLPVQITHIFRLFVRKCRGSRRC
jgi:hypothetical protein